MSRLRLGILLVKTKITITVITKTVKNAVKNADAAATTGTTLVATTTTTTTYLSLFGHDDLLDDCCTAIKLHFVHICMIIIHKY